MEGNSRFFERSTQAGLERPGVNASGGFNRLAVRNRETNKKREKRHNKPNKKSKLMRNLAGHKHKNNKGSTVFATKKKHS